MKYLRRMLFIIAIMATAFMMENVAANAAGTGIIQLRNGRTYQYDLNGDRKNEKIKLQYYTVGENSFRMRISINGKVLLNNMVRDSLDCIWEINAYLLDYNKKDRYKEIYFENTTMDGSHTIFLYRYTGKSLSRIAYARQAQPAGGENGVLKKTQPGNGTLEFSGSLYGYETVYGTYSMVIKNGTLHQKSYTCITDGKKKYYLTRSKRATKTLNGGNTFTVKPRQIFRIQKVYRTKKQCKLYIKMNNGKTGWLSMGNNEYSLRRA